MDSPKPLVLVFWSGHTVKKEMGLYCNFNKDYDAYMKAILLKWRYSSQTVWPQSSAYPDNTGYEHYNAEPRTFIAKALRIWKLVTKGRMVGDSLSILRTSAFWSPPNVVNTAATDFPFASRMAPNRFPATAPATSPGKFAIMKPRLAPLNAPTQLQKGTIRSTSGLSNYQMFRKGLLYWICWRLTSSKTSANTPSALGCAPGAAGPLAPAPPVPPANIPANCEKKFEDDEGSSVLFRRVL